MALPALWFFFLSFSNLEPFNRALLSFCSTLGIFFAIPSLTWPLGSVYYETLAFYMGQLSLIVMFITVALFLRYDSQRMD